MEAVFSQLLALLYALWWPFCRALALLSAAPVVGDGLVPMPLRVLLALALAVVMLPMAQGGEPIDAMSMRGVAATVEQAVIGGVIGLALHFAISAVMVFGYLASSQLGFAMAVMNDPVNGTPSDVVSACLVVLCTRAMSTLAADPRAVVCATTSPLHLATYTLMHYLLFHALLPRMVAHAPRVAAVHAVEADDLASAAAGAAAQPSASEACSPLCETDLLALALASLRFVRSACALDGGAALAAFGAGANVRQQLLERTLAYALHTALAALLYQPAAASTYFAPGSDFLGALDALLLHDLPASAPAAAVADRLAAQLVATLQLALRAASLRCAGLGSGACCGARQVVCLYRVHGSHA
ncbi:type III secretion protein, partial [archaeon]